MSKLIANVLFEKLTQNDNYEEGCLGNHWVVCNDKFSFEFTDTNDLKIKLAEWVSSRFDVNEEDFLQFVENECDNNRFDYSQNEDSEGNQEKITKDNPNGYCSDYFFWVKVIKTEEVDYTF